MSKFREAYEEGLRLRDEEQKVAEWKKSLLEEQEKERFERTLVGARRWVEETLPVLFTDAARNGQVEVKLPDWGDDAVEKAYLFACKEQEDLQVGSFWVDESKQDDMYPVGYYSHYVRLRPAKI